MADPNGVVLHFIVPGKPVSGNHEKIPNPKFFKAEKDERDGIRAFIPTRRSRDVDEKVRILANLAARQQGWKIPEYVRVDVLIWNVRMDRDNVCKALMDPLQGIAFVTDARILDGWTKRAWDSKGARVEVWVRPVDRKDYDLRKKRTDRAASP
jgi:Holliday junction resolvase RusA-like endonuclease